MSKIQAVFERLQARGRKALIPFITAGDPAPELTVPLLHTLVKAGADIIELGVPFSDPMAVHRPLKKLHTPLTRLMRTMTSPGSQTIHSGSICQLYSVSR